MVSEEYADGIVVRVPPPDAERMASRIGVDAVTFTRCRIAVFEELGRLGRLVGTNPNTSDSIGESHASPTLWAHPGARSRKQPAWTYAPSVAPSPQTLSVDDRRVVAAYPAA